ncbi:MAG: hypothetical protein LBT31_02925 [Synergistaceae bacterium]|jgi:hypothetical protein|nr:hypothetical protein [Synergistaceae bacterium]
MDKKKKIVIAAGGLLVFLFFVVVLFGRSSDATLETIGNFLKGDVTGEVGKTYSTKWFNFFIKSVKKVDEYAGYEPVAGNTLVDVVISEKCTFNEATDMSTDDFYLDSAPFDEYVFPMEPIDDTMMPLEFTLAPKEQREYHMLYEIPSDTVGLKLAYTERDVEGNIGATFTINIPD